MPSSEAICFLAIFTKSSDISKSFISTIASDDIASNVYFIDSSPITAAGSPFFVRVFKTFPPSRYVLPSIISS